MIKVAYFRALKPLVARAKALVDSILVPEIPAIMKEATPHADADPKKVARGKVEKLIAQAEAKFKASLKPAQLEAAVAKIGTATDKFQKDQINRQVRSALGVGIDTIAKSEKGIPRKVEGWVALNVNLIKTLPKTYFDDIRLRTIEAVNVGTRHETLAKTLEERYGVAENRAALIARDQVGKLYGNLNEERQKNLGVDGYIWRTSNDNRVREEHEQREGERYTWESPPEDGHPGEPINCRCYAEPDFSSILG